MVTVTNKLETQSSDPHGTGSWSPSAFTPTAGKRLVVRLLALEANDGSLAATDLTISDSQGLTWTPIVGSTSGQSPGWSYAGRAWISSAAAASSTTLTFDAGAFDIQRYVVVVDELDGEHASPIGGTAVGTDADGDGAASITLSSAPASDSYVLAFMHRSDSGASGGVTHGTGWTEEYEFLMNLWGAFQFQQRTGSTSDSVAWDDLDAGSSSPGGAVMLAFEIKAAGAGSSYTLDVDSGSGAGQGQNVTLLAPRALAVDSGSAVGQGQPSTLPLQIAVTHAQGVVAGQEIPFILTNPGTHAEAVFAGQSITLTAPQQLALDAGSVVGQGQTSSFVASLAVTHGQATGQGQAIDLARSMPVTHGEAVFAGQAVTFPVAFALTAGQAVGAGQDINLQFGDSYQLALDHGQGVGEGQEVSLPWTNNLTLVVTHAQVVGSGSNVVLTASGLVTQPAARRFKAISRPARFAVRPMGRFTTRLQ